jgi:transcriptional regulator with XRE-family HTH domain
MVTKFGDELRRCMTERGMSTRQLADLVPCDHGYVSKLTRGVKQVSLEMAARMDDVLDAGGALIEASRNRETPDLAARRLQPLTTAQAEELLGHMQEQWHALVKADNLLGPRYTLTAVLSHLEIIDIILRSVRQQARSRALSLAARYAESAAWLHEDSGDLDGSRHWARRCMEWAIEADAARRNAASLPTPMLAALLLGQPAKALPLLSAAVDTLPAAYWRDRGVALSGLAAAFAANGEAEQGARAALDDRDEPDVALPVAPVPVNPDVLR